MDWTILFNQITTDPVGWFEGQTAVLQMGLVIFALLLFASVLVKLLKTLKPQGNWDELGQRISSWWVMVAFFFGSLFIHPQGTLVFFALTSFLALKEYFSLIQTRMEDHRALLWAYLAVPIQYFWIYAHWEPLFFIFIPVYLFLFLPFRLVLVGQPKGMVASCAKIQWGLMAFVFCFSHVAWLMTLPEQGHLHGGRAFVLYLVFLTEMNDVAQYTWGKLLGKKLFGDNPIAPTISPKKTWEGFIGGVFTTTLLAFLLRCVPGFEAWVAVGAGLVICLSGFFGDLVISAVKRDVGVKDSSHLIPGHGGVLDRVDSLVYTAPLFFHYTAYFLY